MNTQYKCGLILESYVVQSFLPLDYFFVGKVFNKKGEALSIMGGADRAGTPHWSNNISVHTLQSNPIFLYISLSAFVAQRCYGRPSLGDEIGKLKGLKILDPRGCEGTIPLGTKPLRITKSQSKILKLGNFHRPSVTRFVGLFPLKTLIT
jgi:hypothetical protein